MRRDGDPVHIAPDGYKALFDVPDYPVKGSDPVPFVVFVKHVHIEIVCAKIRQPGEVAVFKISIAFKIIPGAGIRAVFAAIIQGVRAGCAGCIRCAGCISCAGCINCAVCAF